MTGTDTRHHAPPRHASWLQPERGERAWLDHPARPRTERLALGVSALVAVAVPTVTALDVQFPGRLLLALAFTLLVPGTPLVVLLRVPDAALAASLTGAVSLAVALLTGTVAAIGGVWDPLAWCTGTAAVGLALTPWAYWRIRVATVAELSPADPLPEGAQDHRLRNRLLSAAALLAAVGFWLLATSRTRLGDAGATGLIGVIGWPYLVAVLIVAGVAAVQLRRPRLDALVLSGTAVVLALIVFGFVNAADSEASFPTAWHHVGFVRYIDVHGASFFGVDARASWPGFFAASAQLVTEGGLRDATPLLRFAPFFYNVAAIAPLLVIARCVTGTRRLAWLSIFIYLGANWFQQDYFSPQATAFLLYLVILATMMWMAANVASPHRLLPARRRRHGRRRAATRAPVPETGLLVPPLPWADPSPRAGRLRTLLWGPRRRPGLPFGVSSRRSLLIEATLILLAAAIVVSHQLTPITLVLSLLIFVLTGHTRYRLLWLIVSLMFFGWLSFGAVDYWAGHLHTVFGDIGQLGSNVNSGVTSRVVGHPTYQLMQELRLLWSVVSLVLAVVGLWLLRRRPNALLVGLIAASTASLVAMQSYGGEVVLRVFVFAAPVLAPLAARTCRELTRVHPHSAVRKAAVGVVLGAFVAGYALMCTATRGVNVAFERVTRDDVAAAEVFWSQVRKGDTLGYLSSTGAYDADHVGQWTAVTLDQAHCRMAPLRCAEQKRPRFIMVSRSQDLEEELLYTAPPGASTEMAASLVRMGRYRVLYQGPDAELLVLVRGGAR